MTILSGALNGIGISACVERLNFDWNSGAKNKAVENRGPYFPWCIERRAGAGPMRIDLQTPPYRADEFVLVHPSGQEIRGFDTWHLAESYLKLKLEAEAAGLQIVTVL